MADKKLIWLGMFVGSCAGSYVPMLFGADMLSGWSMLGSAVGSIAGVIAGYKLSQY